MTDSQTATTPSIKITHVDFADVPLIGADSTLARLTQGDLKKHAPLFDVSYSGSGGAGDDLGTDSLYLNREALAQTLADYNRSIGNELSPATLTAIRSHARFVIAGQQPGLLTGSLLCPLKAITAIVLAKRLTQQTNQEILPAFWIATEDHDLAEVNRTMLGDRKLVIDHDELNQAGPNPPVGRISLQEYRETILTFAREQIGPTSSAPFGREIIQALEQAPYTNYGDFFAHLMAHLFKGHNLIFVDPMHLRPLAAQVMADIAENYTALEQAFDQGAAAVAARDLPTPLNRINLFNFDSQGGRTSVDGATLTPQQIFDNPQNFSPGAALRPLVQDAILPIAATVAGPTELLYLWQIDPLYQVLNLQRSPLVPRMGATILNSHALTAAANVGLPSTQAFNILNLIAESETDSLSPELAHLNQLGDSLLNQIDQLASSTPATPGKVITKGSDSIRHQLSKITQRLSQQTREAQGRGPRALKQVATAIYPGKKLQERTASILPFVAQVGPSLIQTLITQMDITQPGHWLVTIEPPNAEGKRD